MEQLQFLSSEQAKAIAAEYGTPVYVYSEARLKQAAADATAFPSAYGVHARYAMKASPNGTILRIFDKAGMWVDASSGYEVDRALHAGVSPEKIMVTPQEIPHNLDDIIKKGVLYSATSISHLKIFGERHKGATVGLRFNPGLGSGGTNRTNVGGPGSSFGIWHEHIDDVKAIVEQYELNVTHIHTHIGSGSDPAVWQKVAGMSIALLEHFPKVTTLDLGGGFKVGRMADETSTDLQEIGKPVIEIFKQFAQDTGREITLEIEPGTYMVAMAAALVTTIQGITNTGKDGYTFYKIDGGMTEVLRPSLYGAQHPLVVVPQAETADTAETEDAIVSGHCCESGDIFTPAPGDPEGLAPRTLTKATVGDLMVVEGVGAYCSGMTAKNYNSFPEAAEVLITEDGTTHLIRKRQTPDQIWQNEVVPAGY